MDAAQKYAYRYLIYHGTLCIRPIAYTGFRWWDRWNMVYWLRERNRIRVAGEIAEWLHNLALFSAKEFYGFDEAAFWSRLDWLRSSVPGERLESIRSVYLYAVFEFNEGRWPTLEEQSMLLAQR